jgi:hypothetical protein
MPVNTQTDLDARSLVASFWNKAWSEGLWAASWSKSIDGLTPEQAAWTPAPGRHSIWQIVLHMIFWRNNELRRFSGGPAPSAEEVAAHNFPVVTDVSAAAWNETRARFRESQDRLAAAFADPTKDLERAKHLIPHDAYHFGQINYLRALQNLPPIE